MYKFTVKHGDSHLPDFLNGVRRDVLSIKWHVSGLGLRKPNTSEKTPTSSSPLTAERPSDTLTGIRLRHPLPGWIDELLYRHGPLHDGQRNLLVTLVLLHWCILLWGQPSPSQLSPQEAVIAGTRSASDREGASKHWHSGGPRRHLVAGNISDGEPRQKFYLWNTLLITRD